MKKTLILGSVLASILTSFQASAAAPATLRCKADCTTVQGEQPALCKDAALEDFDLETSSGTIVRKYFVIGGWSGDSFDEVKFKAADLDALANQERSTATGRQTTGYSWDKNYLTSWDIVCSAK